MLAGVEIVLNEGKPDAPEATAKLGIGVNALNFCMTELGERPV